MLADRNLLAICSWLTWPRGVSLQWSVFSIQGCMPNFCKIQTLQDPLCVCLNLMDSALYCLNFWDWSCFRVEFFSGCMTAPGPSALRVGVNQISYRLMLTGVFTKNSHHGNLQTHRQNSWTLIRLASVIHTIIKNECLQTLYWQGSIKIREKIDDRSNRCSSLKIKDIIISKWQQMSCWDGTGACFWRAHSFLCYQYMCM